jgi:DNA oxidative demethylase
MTFDLVPRERRELAPGAVHVPDWLDVPTQRSLVGQCRRWAVEGPGIRAAALPNGARMSVRTVCLGWHWIPYRYSRTRDDQDGSPVTPFPAWLGDLGREAVADAYTDPARATGYHPDVALINHYTDEARLGMHRDSDEHAPDPVVSISLGAPVPVPLGQPALPGPPVDRRRTALGGPARLRRREPTGLPRRPQAAAAQPGRDPRDRTGRGQAQHHPARLGARNRMTADGVQQCRTNEGEESRDHQRHPHL